MSRAARWFAHSGIQEPSGGVARYYRTDLGRNHPVSTEITGYAVSALLFLGRPDEAIAAARFLIEQAWSGGVMPFELDPAAFTYFFDCGIIARGLLACWRYTGEQEYLDVAAAIGKNMLADFCSADGDFHPILALPDKQPIPRDPTRWSQCPGCSQLKAALAWWELFEITGNTEFRDGYNAVLSSALRDYTAFLPGHANPLKIVDRLHAFLYFLEGVLPCEDERRAVALCDGIHRVARHLGHLAPEFERSDVYAQLLRIRLFADGLGIVPLDRAAAEREAAILAGFQAASGDSSMDGGFYFGRKGDALLPYVNPVSTAFAAQALALWEDCGLRENRPAVWHQLI
ncbi:MAG TPA: hypothetical protein VH640_06085 [Bryobacteraceae bacterium]